ncbi:MAG: hypothetical protein ACK4H7_04365, partial [Acidilobaceae archaeon]
MYFYTLILTHIITNINCGGFRGLSREATIWEHAEELLIRLRRALIALVISTLIVPFIPISLSSYKPLLIIVPDLILNHAVPRQIEFFGYSVEVLFTAESPFAGLKIYLYSAILVGFIFA